MTVSVSISV